MLLPEAVRHARKELGLSQQKLSDLAGIQRRQLSTLEDGGNITLATLRKVLAQLPNLRTFALDTVPPTIVHTGPPAGQRAGIEEAVRLLTEAVRVLTAGIPEETGVSPNAPDEPVVARGAAGAFASTVTVAARRRRRRQQRHGA